MIQKDQHYRRETGVALVVTLVIMVLLAGMAVALLQTATTERGTSNATAVKTKADLAAQAAANAAIASLVDKITQFPDGATTWETINGNDGTVLYYNDQTPEQAIGSAKPAQLYVYPLTSGGSSQKVADKSSALPALTDSPASTANAYNLNHARSKDDVQGWIGSSPQWLTNASAPTVPQAFRGQWVDLPDSTGKVTGRYAYWMEDESFKANANYMTNNKRAQGLGRAPTEIPFQTVLAAASPSPSDPDAVAKSIVDYRSSFPNGLFFNYRDINQVGGQPTLADTMKFESTIFSGGLNLSRSGSKRVNLNAIVQTSTDATAIRKQMDQIIKPITQELPNFAQRFYRLGSDKNALDVPSSGSPSLRTIYLNKLAANIRDYIDTDSQPTIVNNDSALSIRIGTRPAHPFESTGGGTAGSNEVIAIGKERVPMIQEYALRIKEITFQAQPTFANYTFTIDHYVEFWNVTNKDILVSDLGSNPFVLIADQPGWDANTLDDIPDGAPRDTVLALSAARNIKTGAALTVFPAGSTTVITTDDVPLSALTPDTSRVFQIPVPSDKGGVTGLRTYSGKTDRQSSGKFRINMIDRTTASSDYETEILLGNDQGVLESAWGAVAISTAISVNADTADRLDNSKYHFRGASLRGNSGATSPNAQTGDPRTNAEQLRFDLNGASAGNDKTRYFSDSLQDNAVPGQSSLGAPNSFVDASQWPDYSSTTQSANSGPAVIANAPLTSIGQLGDIFDPVRTKGDATGTDSDGVPLNIKLSRSGGRTLRIGQPDDLWDGTSSSASREWPAWRLLDVFTIDNANQLDGLININGINRDNGAAFKSVLYGYQFLAAPDGDPSFAAATLSDTEVNALVTQMTVRLNNKAPYDKTIGPFAERGELSEMAAFNTGTSLTGQDMSKAFDRGREELFRRLAQLITTRGNIFTVYAVGQALIPQTGPGAQPIIASTSQLKVTFRLDPIWDTNPQTDPNWDPTSDLSTRLAKPKRYVAHILYAGD